MALTAEQIRIAAHIRKQIWTDAVKEVEAYSASKKADGHVRGKWFDSLRPAELAQVAPFPSLPALASFLPENVTVDPEPYTGDFGYVGNTKLWKLGDRLLVGLHSAVNGDDRKLKELILFPAVERVQAGSSKGGGGISG